MKQIILKSTYKQNLVKSKLEDLKILLNVKGFIAKYLIQIFYLLFRNSDEIEDYIYNLMKNKGIEI
ncbi:hypothetical protein [Clostridium sp.]|uniref:hypothetical protein n=1 Tax=Clostridium sp. TaxID=1506 RepID=UPI003F3BB0B3